MTEEKYTPSSNPFSTRFVAPGAIPFVFEKGMDAEQLLTRLRAAGNWGEIIGPHGSGKSCLLATLTALLTESGQPVIQFSLHDGQRHLPATTPPLSKHAGGTLVVVDGYEQLSLLSRLKLRRLCRRRGLGLLISAHRGMGFPLLYQTATSLALAEQLTAKLVPASIADEDPPANPLVIAREFARHGGNLRELWFALYDLYELRRVQRP